MCVCLMAEGLMQTAKQKTPHFARPSLRPQFGLSYVNRLPVSSLQESSNAGKDHMKKCITIANSNLSHRVTKFRSGLFSCFAHFWH